MTGPILDGFKGLVGILDGYNGLLGIQASYLAYFNRPADVNGRQYWETQVDAHMFALDDLTSSFSKAKEYKDLYASKSSSEIVSTIYQNLFNRAPEAAGLKYWTQQLDSGSVGVDKVAYTVMTAAQGTDQSSIVNKAVAADYFTSRLAEKGWGDKYNGAVLAEAKQWLSKVDDKAASVKVAQLTADNVVVKQSAVQAEMFTFKMGYDPQTSGPSVNAHVIKNFDFGVDTIHLVGKGGQLEATNGPTYFYFTDFSEFGGNVADADKDRLAVSSALGFAHNGYANGKLNPLKLGEAVLISYEVQGVLKTVLFVDDTTSGDRGGSNGPGSASWNVDADILIDVTGIVGLKIDPATYTVDGTFFV